jgi:RNase P/RNase MRP subunit p29
MFIKVSKNQQGYYFQVGDDASDPDATCISSIDDNHLISHHPKTYNSFGEAHMQARILSNNNPSCVLAKKVSFYKNAFDEFDKSLRNVSIQDQIVEHFSTQEELITHRLKELLNCNGTPNQQKVSAIAKEIDIVMSGISRTVADFDLSDDDMKLMKKIYNNLDKLKKDVNGDSETIAVSASHELKKQSNKSIDSQQAVDSQQVLMDFGKSAMLTLNSPYPDVYIKDIAKDGVQYIVTLSTEKNDLVDIVFNKDLLLVDVLPKDGSKSYSQTFFDKYWLPIVWSVGHVFIPEHNTLVCAERIHRNANTIEMSGIDVDNKEEKCVSISFQEKISNADASWWIKLSQKQTQKQTQKQSQKAISPTGNMFANKAFREDLIGREVKCIDPTLKSYYGRTGSVESVQVGPDYADIVVDFRRGLDKITLRDSQLEFFDLG